MKIKTVHIENFRSFRDAERIMTTILFNDWLESKVTGTLEVTITLCFKTWENQWQMQSNSHC